MGGEVSKNGFGTPHPIEVRAFVNIYDIAPTALRALAGLIGCGVYHTGVVLEIRHPDSHFVRSVEYAFFGQSPGGIPGGIRSHEPKQIPKIGTAVSTLPFPLRGLTLPPQVPRWKRTLHMGVARIESEATFKRVMENARREWPGSRYDLLKCNCNHFSEALLKTLDGGWALPHHLNRGARVVGYVRSKLPKILKRKTSSNWLPPSKKRKQTRR